MTEIRLRRLIPFYLLATFVGPGESSDKNCQKHVAINQNTFSCCRWRWVAGWIVAINIFRTMSWCAHFIMGPSFLCWSCPSVCLSVFTVPLPRGKTKRPTNTKLGRKGPWDTSTPCTSFKVKGSEVKVTAAPSCFESAWWCVIRKDIRPHCSVRR